MSRAERRFVVSASEALGARLEALNARDALGEGRVFVDGRRARDAALELAPGACIEIYAPRSALPEPRVLAEQGGLVFVDKPAGMATEPERRGERVLVEWVARALDVPRERVHALSRLDLAVSGLVVIGLTSAARERVQRARADGRWRRRYVALAAAAPTPDSGVWSEPIARDGKGPRRAARAGGEPAQSRYAVTGVAPRAAVLALEPVTGRTHQLRVHAAAHAAPFFGDASYGGPTRVVLPSGAVRALERIFLHCAALELPERAVAAPLPPEFAALWSALDGDPAALVRATGKDGMVPAP